MEIQLPQILFQIINFSVVVGVLTYLLYKPVLKIFDERAQRIEEGQKAAAEALEQREAVDQMKQQARTELKKEKTAVLEEATQEATEQKQAILKEARQQAKDEITELKQQWEEERRSQLDQLQRDLVSTVITATGKIVGDSLDAKKHSKLITKELESLVKS